MAHGKIIFLNGTSSSGKTTLAHNLQEILPEPWLHVALDQYRDGLPARFRGLNAPTNTEGARGLNVVPVTNSEPPYTAIRFGDLGRQVLRGMRRSIATLAREGINVIVDDIILEDMFLADYLDVLDNFDVLFVGVKCPIEVINQREAQRPGRFPGTAEGHFESCHQHGLYDLEVNTDCHSPRECAKLVAACLQETRKVSSFDLLRERQ